MGRRDDTGTRRRGDTVTRQRIASRSDDLRVPVSPRPRVWSPPRFGTREQTKSPGLSASLRGWGCEGRQGRNARAAA